MIKKLLGKFSHAILATDVILFSFIEGELCVYCVDATKKEFIGKKAFPGGLVQFKQDLDEAVLQDLKKTSGLTPTYCEQLYTYGNPDRDPSGHVVSTAYLALIPEHKIKISKNQKKEDFGWYAVKKMPKLAYDHKKMLEYAIQRLRWKLEYSTIVSNLLPEQCTLSEMQNIYEVVLDRTLDKRNFRKKVLSLHILKKSGKKKEGEANRPAELFSFRSKKFQIISFL